MMYVCGMRRVGGQRSKLSEEVGWQCQKVKCLRGMTADKK